MNEEITLGYLIDPFEQFQDTNGLPIVSGIVEVYDEDTENLAVIYKDFNQTLQTNPCYLDTLGNVTVIADGTKFYNIIVKDSEGNILLSKNHIKVSNSITETEIINQRAVVLPGNGINVVTTELGNTTNYTVSIDPNYSITDISGADGIEVSADGSNYTVYPTSSLFDNHIHAEHGLYGNTQDLGGGTWRYNVGLNHLGSCNNDSDSIAIGWSTTAVRESLSNGSDTFATDYSHAEGSHTTANGLGCHSEGNYTVANGFQTHAEGNVTTANGYYTHAEGDNTVAEGSGSHAEGNGTTALGNWSHAEGDHCIASGWHSHAEGSNTSAYGSCSHTIGSNTIAYGTNSLAGGFNTIASGSDQTVFGKYNITNETDLFQIGAGLPGNNKNALTISNNGDVNVNTTTGLKNTRVFFDNVGETTYYYTRLVPIYPCSGNDFIPLTNGGDTGIYGVCTQTFNVPSGKKVKVDGFYQIKGGIGANGGVSNWAADPICETWIIDVSTSSSTQINQAVITNGGNLPRSVPIPFSFVTSGYFKLGFCTEGTWSGENFTNRAGQTNPTAGNLFISYTTTIIDKE